MSRQTAPLGIVSTIAIHFHGHHPKRYQLAVARQRGNFGSIIKVRKLLPTQGGASALSSWVETRPQQHGCGDQSADPGTADR